MEEISLGYFDKVFNEGIEQIKKEILNSIINQLEDVAVVQSEPNFEGFYMTMTMAPLTDKPQTR